MGKRSGGKTMEKRAGYEWEGTGHWQEQWAGGTIRTVAIDGSLKGALGFTCSHWFWDSATLLRSCIKTEVQWHGVPATWACPNTSKRCEVFAPRTTLERAVVTTHNPPRQCGCGARVGQRRGSLHIKHTHQRGRLEEHTRRSVRLKRSWTNQAVGNEA